MNTGLSYSDEILVVDDTSASLKLLEDILTGAGYRVRLAPDGEVALRSIKVQYPVLILLDIRMPGMDGYEVCRRLKEDEGTRSIPIIFLSILENEQEKTKAFQVGGIDYINKPVRAEEVLARVNTHLALRHAQLDLEARNNELEAARSSLEEKVAARSAELERANRQLRRQIEVHLGTLEALQKSEARLNITQRVSKVGGWEYDVSTGTTVWTEELYRIHELPDDFAGDLVQANLNCYSVEDRSKVEEAIGGAAEREAAFDLESPFTTSKGRALWIRTTVQPVYEDGKVVRVMGCLMDITERKRAEEEVRKLNEVLEERVRARTVELEEKNEELARLNRVFIGRELRMRELKEQLKEQAKRI